MALSAIGGAVPSRTLIVPARGPGATTRCLSCPSCHTPRTLSALRRHSVPSSHVSVLPSSDVCAWPVASSSTLPSAAVDRDDYYGILVMAY